MWKHTGAFISCLLGKPIHVLYISLHGFLPAWKKKQCFLDSSRQLYIWVHSNEAASIHVWFRPDRILAWRRGWAHEVSHWWERETNYIYYIFIYYLFIWKWWGGRAMTYVCWSENNLWEFILSFHYGVWGPNSGHQTWQQMSCQDSAYCYNLASANDLFSRPPFSLISLGIH